MKKRKKKSLHKFDFNSMHEDMQFIVLILFMIVGAIITVITYPFRFFKKSKKKNMKSILLVDMK
jgi:flagellar basal body-associated protein FliL